MTDTVRLAIDQANPPFTFVDEVTGEPRGFTVELTTLCFADADCAVEFVVADGPFTQSIWLTTGRVDCAADMTTSDRRRQWYAFSDRYYVDELAAFGRIDGPLWAGFDRIAGPLAVKANGYAEEWLRRHHPRTALRPVNDAAHLLEAVNTGRAAAFVTSRVSGLALLGAICGHAFRQAGPTFGPAGLALAVPLDGAAPPLRRFNRALAEVRADGRLDELLRRWRLLPV